MNVYDCAMPCARRVRARGLVAPLALGVWLGAGVLLLAPASRADSVAVINAIRVAGCGDPATTGAAVLRNAELDAVARELPRRALSDAVQQIGYPAARSVSFHTKGSLDDATLRRVLTASHCAAVTDPGFGEIGVFQRADEIWLVLATRKVEVPIVLDPVDVAQRVLTLVNTARQGARSCGERRFEAAPPITLSTPLTVIARLHARDMAQRLALTHEGADGSRAADRIARFGYPLQGSGENIAAGQRNADAVVAAWLGSPGHCANIMEPRFTEMGAAFALAPEGSNPGIYWTQVFATPR